MKKGTKRILLFIILSIVFICKNYALSQTNTKADKEPKIRFGEISFKLREIESIPSNIKFLEIHIEILNLSKNITLPENSVKLILIPQEIKYKDISSDVEWLINKEEKWLDFSIPPSSGRLVVFGFSLPKEIPQSIKFEIQMNPPHGDKKIITWEGK